MEQITLIFLIGAFILFLLQLGFKKEFALKIMGLFASTSVVGLSLVDPVLLASEEWLTVMIVSGFAMALYSLVGLYRGN